MSGTEVKVGDKIRIVKLLDPLIIVDNFIGKEGFVTYIDKQGRLEGTWGKIVIQPEDDEFIIL
jgi:hypothetical protein